MKLDNPLISVIIPVYKVEKYLKRCVDSVINQSYKNLEIILVDDGSPDKCGDICDEYKKNDSRVVVIHKKNGGLSDARNFGLDIAKGEYIMFVDSDDWIHHEMVDRLYNGIVSENAQISISNFVLTSKENEPFELCTNSSFSSYEKEDFLNNFFWSNLSICVTACWKLYKKQLFENIRYPKGKLIEDVMTTPRLISVADRIAFTPEIMYFYFQHEESIMHNSDFEIHEKEVESFVFCLEEVLKSNFFESYVKGIPRLLLAISEEYAYLVKNNKSRKKIKKYSSLAKKYVKLGKKLGRKYYSMTIGNYPYVFEAAYPTFMKYYWIWCSLKTKIFKK